jgi:DNA polymerase
VSDDRQRAISELRERLLFYREIGLTEIRRPQIAAEPPSREAASTGIPDNQKTAPAGGGKSVEGKAGALAAKGGTAPPAVPAPPEAPTPPDAPPEMDGLFTQRYSLPEGADPAEVLETLRADEIGDCKRCKLCDGRNTIVFGSGNSHARLMFVGEGPGADEDAQGLPFVGRGGQKLTEMIEKGMRIPRPEVYIANIIKCRPPNNRAPEPDEISACEGYLFKQVDIIRPSVIVALGRFAAQTLLRTKMPISSLRGRFWKYRDTLLMPTFHPAFLLRQYTPENRRIVWEDLKKVKQALDSRPGV